MDINDFKFYFMFCVISFNLEYFIQNNLLWRETCLAKNKKQQKTSAYSIHCDWFFFIVTKEKVHDEFI